MTETAETPVEASSAHAEPLSPPKSGDHTGEAPNGSQEPKEGKGHREERFRKERNEAQAALVVAQERITRMQRAEIERLAADALSHPADLFSLSGNDVADYLTEDGDVDPERVAADVAAVLAERPGLRKNAPAFDPTQGHGNDGPKPQKKAATWGSAFKRVSSAD